MNGAMGVTAVTIRAVQRIWPLPKRAGRVPAQETREPSMGWPSGVTAVTVPPAGREGKDLPHG